MSTRTDCDGCGGDNPATRFCLCGRVYCGHCWCDCADWHVVVHEGHEGGYAACSMPECVQLRASCPTCTEDHCCICEGDALTCPEQPGHPALVKPEADGGPPAPGAYDSAERCARAAAYLASPPALRLAVVS